MQLITIGKDGTADRVGVVTPNGTRFHSFKRKTSLSGHLSGLISVLTIKVPGHNFWRGRGMRGYAGPEFEMYRVIEMNANQDGSHSFKCEYLYAIPSTQEPITADTFSTETYD